MIERPTILPHHFEPLKTNGLWIVPCPEVDIKISFDEKHKGSDGFRDLGKFSELQVLISGADDREIGSIHKPLPSKSPDSKADYLMWREVEIGDEKILIAVQMLLPLTMTSHHTHNSSTEIFQKLHGKLYSFHNQEVVRIENRLRIQPGDSHLSFTTNQPAITLLVQRGENIKHNHLNQPDYEFLKQQADLLDKQLGY